MAAKSTAQPTRGRSDGNRPVATNRRARHEYDILDTFEAGIVLVGAEVKSLREGAVQIREAYARVQDGEVWLHAMHLQPYSYANGFGAADPDRVRKLLLHRKQIADIAQRTSQDSVTLIPLSVYFSDGRAKVELAVARGRRHYDKRRAIANRDADREARRVASEHQRAGRI